MLHGETIGWLCEKRVIKDLTIEEYSTLLSLLSHQKARLRWSAADRLGKIGDSRAVEHLLNALKDEHWLVRLHTAKALGRIGDPVCMDPLIDTLDDQCPYVRRRVATALGQVNNVGDRKVIEALITALSDSDRYVRSRVASELGKIGSPSVVTAIAAAVRDPDANVSWRAADALQRIGSPAIAPLINLLTFQDCQVRYRATKVFGKIGDHRAAKLLEKILNDPDEKVRWRANLALRELGYHPSKDGKPQQWWERFRK